MPTPLLRVRLTRTGVAGACVALALSGSIALTPLVAAQESTSTPAASPVASPQATPQVAQQPATVTPLMAYSFTAFPEAPMTVRLLRITLAPGASVPMHTHPGPEFDRVESGVLTAQSSGDALVFASGSTEGTKLSSTSADLKKNDWILYPAETGMALTNNGDENVVLLSAVVLPVGTDAPESITYADGSPDAAAFEGVSFTVLGDGLLPELPAGETEVTIDQVELPAGTDLPASQNPVLLSRIDGNLSFKVKSGNVQVSRSAEPGLQPNAIPNQQFTLETGDAAFFQSGVSLTPRAGEDTPLSFYRLTIQPASSLTASPATITFTAPQEATAAATPAPAGTPTATPTAGFSEGSLVRTSQDGINMRAEPSVDAAVVNELNADIELRILEGPVEADGFTWYHVELTSEGEGDWHNGWIAKDFLISEAAPEAAATPSATAAATPSANATPGAAAFQVDEIVVTTEDDVRIRTEASLEGDAFEILPKGTRLIVTGEPVVAEQYTWYPVTAEDNPDITGWIVADFLKKAS